MHVGLFGLQMRILAVPWHHSASWASAAVQDFLIHRNTPHDACGTCMLLSAYAVLQVQPSVQSVAPYTAEQADSSGSNHQHRQTPGTHSAGGLKVPLY